MALERGRVLKREAEPASQMRRPYKPLDKSSVRLQARLDDKIAILSRADVDYSRFSKLKTVPQRFCWGRTRELGYTAYIHRRKVPRPGSWHGWLVVLQCVWDHKRIAMPIQLLPLVLSFVLAPIVAALVSSISRFLFLSFYAKST